MSVHHETSRLSDRSRRIWEAPQLVRLGGARYSAAGLKIGPTEGVRTKSGIVDYSGPNPPPNAAPS